MNERLSRITFVLLEIVLLALVPVLAFKGFHAVLDTTEGRTVDPELDPTDPGYEAFVSSTPVLAVFGIDDAGALSWATVLALAGPQGGGAVVLLPASTVVRADPLFALPEQTLAERYATAGASGARQAIAELGNVEIAEVVELPRDRMAELLAPVSPLAVDNIDAIGDYDAGQLSLGAGEVADLLLAREDFESDLTREARHEEVWRAWIAAISASTDPDVVPGEQTSGIGRFLRGLAAGAPTFDLLPLTEVIRSDLAVTYEADAGSTVDLFEERVPFPAAGRIGSRVRVRVLDGAGADGLAAAVGRDVVRAGGQVMVAGNADSFDVVATRLVYFDPGFTDRVEDFARQLGVEPELIDGPNPDDRVDVILVAGTEAAAAYGLPLRQTTNGDDAG